MDEYNAVDNCQTKEQANNGFNIFSQCNKPLKGFLKKIITFVCYGPGVLGFLWLIGRILKR
jgi:hypothetical protein